MNTADLVRLVDSISRDKNIEKELVYEDIESAMVSAARKTYGLDDDVTVKIDRTSGVISAAVNGEPIEMKDLPENVSNPLPGPRKRLLWLPGMQRIDLLPKS